MLLSIKIGGKSYCGMHVYEEGKETERWWRTGRAGRFVVVSILNESFNAEVICRGLQLMLTRSTRWRHSLRVTWHAAGDAEYVGDEEGSKAAGGSDEGGRRGAWEVCVIVCGPL